MNGDGIGPKALLSVNDVNLGDIFVNETQAQEICIENRGEIDCKFELLPNERAFGKMFDFDLKAGHLQVGEKKYIKWVFKSSIPGEFKETFRWKLEGSNELLSVLFIGHVIAPVFTID